MDGKYPMNTRKQLFDHIRDTLANDELSDHALMNTVNMVEAEANRNLRCTEMVLCTHATTQAGVDKYALPTDYLQMIDVELDRESIPYITPISSDKHTNNRYYPRYTIIGGWLKLFPTPAVDSPKPNNVLLWYYNRIPPLGGEHIKDQINETNWLLNKHYDYYFYAMLIQMEMYTADDERAEKWKILLDQVTDQINRLGVDEVLSGSELNFE
jgi:hypothetical protein